MNDHFALSLQGTVAHLQLNCADCANALTPAVFAALREAVRDLHDGGVVRALVVSATGANFSAGMAAEAGAPAAPSPTERRNPNESAAREAVGAILQMLDDRGAPGPASSQAQARRPLDALHVLADAPFPVICAVQGRCDGAALALACACDIRLCSADASFAPHDDAHASTADPAVLRALARLLPAGTVRTLAYTGDRLGAEPARAFGFVDAVLPDAAALLQHALALAARIAARSPLPVSAAKAALRHGSAADWVALLPAAPNVNA